MPRRNIHLPEKHINNRIAAAHRPRIQLEELEALVFPVAQYPNAWVLNPANGKPACRIVLLAALRRLKYTVVLNSEMKRIVV